MILGGKNTGNTSNHTHFSGELSDVYYEYKYLVAHNNLERILGILNHLYKASDPFPVGVVDSIYYDTNDLKFFEQCMNGEGYKDKFRIRGYGNNSYGQLHQKTKRLSSVDKLKTKIKQIYCRPDHAPNWSDIQPFEKNNNVFNNICYNSQTYGMLYPAARVKYKRFRYRIYDYRITLDTNIEVSSLINGIPFQKNHHIVEEHVLEIKTRERRPTIPLLGLIKLPQVSYSKYMLGVNALNPI